MHSNYGQSTNYGEAKIPCVAQIKLSKLPITHSYIPLYFLYGSINYAQLPRQLLPQSTRAK